jgi:hypothetical protein
MFRDQNPFLTFEEIQKIFPNVADVVKKHPDSYQFTLNQLQLLRSMIDNKPLADIEVIIAQMDSASKKNLFFYLPLDVGPNNSTFNSPLSVALGIKHIEVVGLILDYILNEITDPKNHAVKKFGKGGGSSRVLDAKGVIDKILYDVINQVAIDLSDGKSLAYGNKLMNCLIDAMVKHGVSCNRIKDGIDDFFSEPYTEELKNPSIRPEMVKYYSERLEAKQACYNLLESFIEVSKNSRVLSQGARDENSPMFKLPIDLSVKIAADTRSEGMDENDALQIARNYSGKPGSTKK